MKESANNHSSTSRAIASSNKSERGGLALPAPKNAFPVQMVGEGKSSIVPPPDVDRSGEIPDLPQTLVDQLKEAKGDDSKREAAIDALYKHLEAKNIIEVPPPSTDPKNPPIEIIYTYHNSKGGSRAAYTQYVSSGKQTQVALHIYSSIFDGSIASLYSTIRHELIHAAQQTQSADDKTSSADEYIFGLEDDVTLGKKLVHPLQEIETHVWELVHADETGIAVDNTYFEETEKFLVNYTNDAIKYISGARTEVSKVKAMGGYIHKAINHLRTVPLSGGEKLAEDLQKAYDDKISGKKQVKDPLALQGSGVKKKSAKK